MDSPLGRVLADALMPLSQREDGSFALLIPSGMTKQVWLRIAPPREIEPRMYQERLLISAGADRRSVPVTIRISSVEFPVQPRLTQIWWDYTDAATYDLTVLGAQSLHLAVRDLREHFVDQTWAHAGASGMPLTKDHFNEKHELVKPLDFSVFDAWVDRWDSQANYYAVFLSVRRDDFCGKQFGTDDWRARITAWTAAWRRHVIEKGIDPAKVCVLIMDEHSTDEQAAVILEWLKAIKTGFPEINTMATIMRKDVDTSAVQELYTKLDILIPNWSDYLPAADYYAKLQARGAKLWSYHNLPIDSAHPYGHHRLYAWRAWERGMTGIGFWAYCDSYGNGSWNPYAAVSPPYSPVYFGPGTVHDGKRFEAVREGVQDYERLALLRDRISYLKQTGRNDIKIAAAEELLAGSAHRVLSAYERQTAAGLSIDTLPADKMAADVLSMLEDLQHANDVAD